MTKQEKFSILSQMFALAEVDGKISNKETNFLLAVANQIGVSDLEFEELLSTPSQHVHLKPEVQRIVQFHRLVLLMNVDEDITEEENNKLMQIGLKLGLPSQAILTTLSTMHNYENKMIPPNVLIDIFKAHYN